MSFPRAKIHRFNDVKSCTPSPADYNVRAKQAAVGAIIPQSERFAVPQSPAFSDNSSQISVGTPSSKKSSAALKKKLPQSTTKPNPKDLFGNDHESLQEKIVEIANKDGFINDLVEQLEELKQQINDLKLGFDIEQRHINEQHERELEDLKARHQTESESIKNSLKEIECELESIKNDHKNLKVVNKADLAEIQKNLGSFQNAYNLLNNEYTKDAESKNAVIQSKENELIKLQDTYKNLKKEHEKEINEIKDKHAREIEDVQYEMLKAVTEAQTKFDNQKQEYITQIKALEKTKMEELRKMQEEFEKTKDILKTEAEMQITHLKEDFKEANILCEMQMTEKIKDIEASWIMKLDEQEKKSEQILKECQAISEYNIIQCEVEKNGIKGELQKALESLEEMEKQKKALENQANVVNTELSNKIDEIKQLQEELCNTEEKHKKDERAYEITITQLHGTIEALKKRLINSDRDVMQLKEELEQCEKSKLELEIKCSQLKDEIKALQTLNEEFEVQQDSVEKRVNILEQSLLKQIDDFKNTAQKNEANLRKTVEEKEILLQDAMQQMKEQQIIITESQKLLKQSKSQLENLEEKANKYEFENKCLKTNLEYRNKEIEEIRQEKFAEEELRKQIKELEDKALQYYKHYEYHKSKNTEYESEIEELSGIRKKYIELSGKYDETLQRYEVMQQENEKLSKKVSEQESLIGPFREQLRAYEIEHRDLMKEKRDAEAEAKEMALKYASILGHQNHKQKIKHFVNLQKKKHELESKVRNQEKTIAELDKKIASMSKNSAKKGKNQINDKENINSPNRSLHVSQCDSPGALKERN